MANGVKDSLGWTESQSQAITSLMALVKGDLPAGAVFEEVQRCVRAIHDEAYDSGRQDERADVVARGRVVPDDGVDVPLAGRMGFIDTIERGEHIDASRS